jgi:homoprotocatechuate degradation regulator HpaR
MRSKPKADGDATPRSTRRSLPMALLRAREAVMARFRPMLAAHGVTEQQWRVIRVLGEVGPLDATELSARSWILTPSMSRIIRGLAERKLITAKKSENDGRRLVIAITPKAEALLREVTPESNAIYAELEARFGKARIEDLLDTLDRLTETRP